MTSPPASLDQGRSVGRYCGGVRSWWDDRIELTDADDDAAWVPLLKQTWACGVILRDVPKSLESDVDPEIDDDEEAEALLRRRTCAASWSCMFDDVKDGGQQFEERIWCRGCECVRFGMVEVDARFSTPTLTTVVLELRRRR